ncbi:MAG: hypothetical protein KJ556_21810 [Gammaproteobacteria bacterium]|nr:hypothetical protein [Gammaproteobacteria bacterium]MBU2249656.1 hypothetical protein [Gammaproteobacteria bacterium]
MLHMATYKLQNPKKRGTYFMVSVPPVFRRAYAAEIGQKLFCYTASIGRKHAFLASLTPLSKKQPIYAELQNIDEAGKYSLSEQGKRGMRMAVPKKFVKLAKLKAHHSLSCHIDGDTLIYLKEK